MAILTEFSCQNSEPLVNSTYVDILATFERVGMYFFMNPVLYLKGFQALQWHGFFSYCLKEENIDLANHMQIMISEKVSLDIHPVAEVGNGNLMDWHTEL